jgi:hypothetical protein
MSDGMRRHDLAMIVGAILFGFGFTGPKVILTLLACFLFFIAALDRLRERKSDREPPHD